MYAPIRVDTANEPRRRQVCQGDGPISVGHGKPTGVHGHAQFLRVVRLAGSLLGSTGRVRGKKNETPWILFARQECLPSGNFEPERQEERQNGDISPCKVKLAMGHLLMLRIIVGFLLLGARLLSCREAGTAYSVQEGGLPFAERRNIGTVCTESRGPQKTETPQDDSSFRIVGIIARLCRWAAMITACCLHCTGGISILLLDRGQW